MSTRRSLHASSKGIGIDLDVLVQQVRKLVRPSITKRCGTIQILDMPQPIQLNDIYTSINILETITGRRQLEIPHLLQGCTLEDFDDFAPMRVNEKLLLGVTAVERYSKLIVLGKPVSGKTTFLKYLAIQCSLGEIFGDRVPIFIGIKDFAEAPGQPSLQKYITQMFELSVAAEVVEQLLSHGRALVLLGDALPLTLAGVTGASNLAVSFSYFIGVYQITDTSNDPAHKPSVGSDDTSLPSFCTSTQNLSMHNHR